MSEDSKLPTIYLLVKQIIQEDGAHGGFQLTVANDPASVESLAKDGFRAFALSNEIIYHA